MSRMIDRTIAIASLAPDLVEHPVQMPLIAGTVPTPTKATGTHMTELQTPDPDGFIAHDNPAFG
jgi:hypothetical protein